MSPYITTHGVAVDLDDPNTYKDYPQDVTEVINELYKKIGYSQVYMIRYDFVSSKYGREQMYRIQNFLHTLAIDWKGKDLLWWQKQLFLFRDEVENMC